jgi:hypothetical protein
MAIGRVSESRLAHARVAALGAASLRADDELEDQRPAAHVAMSVLAAPFSEACFLSRSPMMSIETMSTSINARNEAGMVLCWPEATPLTGGSSPGSKTFTLTSDLPCAQRLSYAD